MVILVNAATSLIIAATFPVVLLASSSVIPAKAGIHDAAGSSHLQPQATYWTTCEQ